MVGGKQPTSAKLPKDIIDFTLGHNTKGRFNSALYHYDNFVAHIKKIVKCKQVLSFYKQDKLIGVCGWVLIDSIKDMNKLRWTFPDDISSGRILYVTFAVMTEGASVLKIKKYFDENVRHRIDKACWNNSIRKTIYYKGV